MSKLFNNQNFRSILRALKPWAAALVFILILRFTGALSGISFLTTSLLMESGVMDADPRETDQAAPDFDYDFTIKDLAGNKVNFKRYQGKVVFLNLWATWCGPCRVEMPSIQELYDGVDTTRVAFVMLSLDSDENHPKIVKYVADKKFTFPVFQPSGHLPKQLRVSSIPTTFVIGIDGKIKTTKVGAANYSSEKFKKFLKSLIPDN